MSIDVSGIKQGQRTMWTAGDYPEVARRIESVGEYLAERAGAGPGIELLDVATGSGNVSIPAASAGAKVTGLDLTPKLLDAQRARAAAAGVEVELVEGDAEELPFADGSFDRVTSCFGVMFAPRHDVAAAELVRVARPGGRIVVAAWTPEGLVGRIVPDLGGLPAAAPARAEPAGDVGHRGARARAVRRQRRGAVVRAAHRDVRRASRPSVARTRRADPGPGGDGESGARAAGPLRGAAQGRCSRCSRTSTKRTTAASVRRRSTS